MLSGKSSSISYKKLAELPDFRAKNLTATKSMISRQFFLNLRLAEANNVHPVMVNNHNNTTFWYLRVGQ